uniref:Odorant receptor n=1 Tax=Zeugodacus cucurbitae TaxID=28588 RepID=A0A5H2WW20_ZEUCU
MQRLSELLYERVESDCETNKPFKLLFYFWTWIGIKSKPRGFLSTLHMVCVWIMFFFTPFLATVGFIRKWKVSTVTECLSTLQAFINAIAASAKAFAVLMYFKRIKNVEPIMKDLDERYKKPHERQQISDCVASCTRLYASIWFIYYLYGNMSILTAIVLHKQPFGGWYPFLDVIPNPTVHFYSCFIFETCYMYLLLTAQYLNDLFPTLYMRTIRTHIQLLRERVSQVGADPDMSDEEKHQQLIDCIDIHQQILKVVNIVGSICSPTIFIQFSVVAIVHCICMVNIFIFADNLNLMITIIYYITVAMEILPTCYEASTLEMESSKLPVSIFHSNWLALDMRGRKLIIFFIRRAQVDVSFVAMQMFKINLQTYLVIAKFSFTLYTFVNEMGFGQNIKDLME